MKPCKLSPFRDLIQKLQTPASTIKIPPVGKTIKNYCWDPKMKIW